MIKFTLAASHSRVVVSKSQNIMEVTLNTSMMKDSNLSIELLNFNEGCKLAPSDTETFHPALVALNILLYIILETLGNIALFAMIVFEKYGMDYQKRTVTNQLLSSMLVALILFNVFILSLWMVVKIFGAGNHEH